MEYRLLGRTGLKVSVLSVGTWQLAGPVSLDGRPDGFPDPGRAQAIDLIRACGDLGINSIDSAEVYGGGEGERRVGEALQGQRDRWIVTTKFGVRVGPRGERVMDAAPETIRSSLEGSLRRLRSDYVDVYLYHCPPAANQILEGRHVLDTLKREGKLRAYGISTDLPEQLAPFLLRDALEVVMLPQSLRRHPGPMLNAIAERGLGLMLRGAFEAGLLSGRYFREQPRFADDDIRKARWYPASSYAFYDKLRPKELPMPVFALRYLLDLPTTQTIVLGGSSLAHYQQAIAAVEAARLAPAQHLLVDGVRNALDLQDRARNQARALLEPLRKLRRAQS